jgi:hypothetical protein
MYTSNVDIYNTVELRHFVFLSFWVKYRQCTNVLLSGYREQYWLIFLYFIF